MPPPGPFIVICAACKRLPQNTLLQNDLYFLPKTLGNFKLNFKEGNKFEVIEKDGGIFLCPVVVYPKNEMLLIAKLIKETDAEYKSSN